MSELEGRAFVTGGGRGIGANIARELAGAGMEVAVSGRTAEQVEAVAAEIGGRALVGDVSRRDDVERWFAELGEVDLLVANAGTGSHEVTWEVDPEEWWSTFEVNVLGVHLSCRTVIPGMLERGRGRIVIVGSGSSVPARGDRDRLHGLEGRRLPLRRDARERAPRPDPRLRHQPGLVQTAMTVRLPGRRAVDAAGVRAAARARARLGGVRRARGPLPPRRARPAGVAPRTSRRDRRARLERHPPAAAVGTASSWFSTVRLKPL